MAFFFSCANALGVIDRSSRPCYCVRFGKQQQLSGLVQLTADGVDDVAQ